MRFSDLWPSSESGPTAKCPRALLRFWIESDRKDVLKKVLGGKIPYSISMKDDSPFVFAGLWEGWKDPANGEWLHTCTIITGEPNEFVREIHIRMPVILPEVHHDCWLSGEAGKEVLVPYPADRMKAWPVSPRVNDPSNNDPEIVIPIETESVARPENLPQLL